MSEERLSSVRARLRAAAVERGADPRDVDVLLADAIDRSVPFVVAHGELSIDPAPLEEKLGRRWRGEPLQYIRRRADFYGREFYVDDRVLIPRPETELVVEAAVLKAPKGSRIVDIGTGSGCIAISIERERPDLRVTGVDVSLAALAVAAKNRSRLQSRIGLAASDVLSSIRAGIDMIVSNPPYIPQRDIAGLQVEVRNHEPWAALTPGPAGTEAIERILDDAHRVLRPDGRVIMEIGFGQEKSIRELAATKQFGVEEVIPDLAAIPRVIVLSAHA